MISRHERLFGKGGEDASGDAGWEAVKRREKGQQTLTDSLRDVPGYLPALMHAYKVLRKAASAGVDPLSGAEAIRALRKALEDAQEALDEGKDASEALGRLLFAAAGAARGCVSQPELLLRAETERFIARFERMEPGGADGRDQAGGALKGRAAQTLDAGKRKVRFFGPKT